MTTTPTRPVAARISPRDPARGALLCLLSATGFGLTPLFAKQAYADGVTVPTLLAARFALAAVLVGAVVAWRARTGRLAAPLLPSRRVLAGCVLLGVLYAFQAGAYFGALTRIDASLTALLLYAYPAIVAVLAIALRRESLDARRVVALVASAIGLLLLLGGADMGSADSLGVLLAVVTAGGYAAYLTLAAGLPDALDVLVMAAIVCVVASVALALAGLVSGTLVAPGPGGWTWIALLAVCCTVVPVSALFAGMRHVGASNGAILSCAEPLVVVVSAAIVYGERLSPVQLVGGLALGVAVLVLQARRSARRAADAGAEPPAPSNPAARPAPVAAVPAAPVARDRRA